MATRPNAAATSQALTLLGQFTDSIDSLPHDLTKAFGDLRELDAVLRSSMQGITSKVYKLIDLMEDTSATPAARLCLLLEIAEDAQRLRMGSEDKIRVAGRTADDVAAHNQYNHQILNHLSELDPGFEEALYIRRTTFPHVAPANLLPPTGEYALGRRGRRGLPGGVAQSTVSIGARLSAPMAISASAGGDKNKKRRLEEEEARRTPVKGKEKDQRMAAEKDREAAADSRKAKKVYVDIYCTRKRSLIATHFTDGHKGRRHLMIPLAFTEIATSTNNTTHLRQHQMGTRITSHQVTTKATMASPPITVIRIRITSLQHIFHRHKTVMGTRNLNYLTLLLVPIHRTRCLLMMPNIRSNQRGHRLSLTSSPTAQTTTRIIAASPRPQRLNLTTTSQWTAIHVVQGPMVCEPPVAVGAEAATRMEMDTAQHQRRALQDVELRTTRHPAF
ncbi:hypothetical protein FRC00_012580 [Tulasnella sp. 408]|nr:hypothetical protein FRC00_012580 [Tulasnella sp. 408]